MIARKKPKHILVPLILAAASLVFLLLPLAAMFGHMDAQSVRAVFQKEGLGQILVRSVTASGLVTLISVSLAWAMAWCLERTAMAPKGLCRILVTLPMLLPSVSIGMGTVLLCGNSGILTNLIGLGGSGLYGLPGIVWGGVLYSLPVAFLMISNTLRFEDRSPYEAANVLGIPKWRQFCSISVPYLRKPMIGVAFSVFTLSFTDYGVPLVVGGQYKTLPVVMYQEVIGQLEFGRGCVYGSFLLVPALAAFLLDLLNRSEATSATVTRPFHPIRSQLRDGAAQIISGVICTACLMPIGAFLVLAFVEQYPTDLALTFENFRYTFRSGGGRYLVNSVVIALLSGLCGVLLAIAAAYYTARVPCRLSRLLHLLCLSMAAIPGVVLGLGYVLTFRGTPLYGTLAILVAVNTVHFFASPYLMLHTAFGKIHGDLESVAWTLGIGRQRLLLDVMLPMCSHTLREMFSCFFVNSMMTISAVSFLAGTRTKPMALMINQFESQARMGYAAVVSLSILAVNLAVKLLLEWLPAHKKET